MTADIRKIGDSHEIAARWFFRMASEDVSDRERRAFEEWLAEDERNRRDFVSVSETWGAMDGLIADHHHELQAMVMCDTHQAMRQSRKGLQRRRLIAASVAAFTITAIGGGTWFATQPLSYHTELGERRVVRLADGSTISLDANTSVRVRLTDNERKLWLDSGRARFNVASDPLRPFSVTAGDRVVVATGTSFSVEKLAVQVRVLLYEGSVAVQNEDTGSGFSQSIGAPTRKVAVGQELVLGEGTSLEKAPTATPDLSLSSSWESGLLSFDATPLPTAVERMNRYSSRKMVVAKSAANVRVSGVFKTDNAQGFIEGVTSVMPVAARENGDTIVLTGK